MTIKIDEATRIAIVRSYEAGVDIDEIARIYKVHRSYPTKLARRRGIEMRRANNTGDENDDDK